MSSKRSGWQRIDEKVAAWTYTYSFGGGLANAFAFQIEGGLAVVSPPRGVEADAYAALEAHGPVRMLIAPNAFHHMGLAGWKARFPEAPIFAPAQSIARIEKHSKLADLRPVAEASELVGARVTLVDMPYYRTGEVLIELDTPGGCVWLVTDLLFNEPKAPSGVVGLVFKWTRSMPGFRMNGVGTLFMVKERTKLRHWLAAEADRTSPRLIVPAHGDILRTVDPTTEVRRALDLM